MELIISVVIPACLESLFAENYFNTSMFNCLRLSYRCFLSYTYLVKVTMIRGSFNLPTFLRARTALTVHLLTSEVHTEPYNKTFCKNETHQDIVGDDISSRRRQCTDVGYKLSISASWLGLHSH